MTRVRETKKRRIKRTWPLRVLFKAQRTAHRGRRIWTKQSSNIWRTSRDPLIPFTAWGSEAVQHSSPDPRWSQPEKHWRRPEWGREEGDIRHRVPRCDCPRSRLIKAPIVGADEGKQAANLKSQTPHSSQIWSTAPLMFALCMKINTVPLGPHSRLWSNWFGS